jgi:membrane-associated phospholipid phosphatase
LQIRSLVGAGVLAAALLFAGTARAGGGLLGLDHLVPLDDHGIWARSNQILLINTMLVGEVGVALWEGNDSRLGHTTWQSIDATVVGGVAAQGMKLAFSRSRPNQSPDPDLWFQGSGHVSFPSGEVTVVSAIVTPVVLEYRHDHPWVYGLEVLPLYDAIARVKVHGHWQSDVLAGYALGTAAGYYMRQRQNTPLVLSILPDGFYVGFKKRFN